MKCLICNKSLEGRQSKYCSRVCKNTDTNHRHQSYLAQQQRGKERKLLLINMAGGGCDVCGYSKNHAALEFHHLREQEKSFQLDLRSLSNRSWQRVLHEFEKCRLLCSNCHAELHHPECGMQ